MTICIICGKFFIKKTGNQIICSDECRNTKIPCAICGKLHKPRSKNNKGEYICSTCEINLKDDVECIICGKKHKPYVKNDKGEYVCFTCHKKSKDDVECAMCGRLHKLHSKNDKGEYICGSCYSVSKCKEIIVKNMQYYNFEDEEDVYLFISDMKKKYPHARMYRQLECELLGYGNYNEAMDQALIRDNNTCQITGKKGNVVVHHLNSYNTHKELACDLDNLISLDQDFHNLYHDTCGRGNNTEKQFWEFVEKMDDKYGISK